MYSYQFDMNMMRSSSVIFYARGDVNGDRIPDNIYLTGRYTTDSAFMQNITLIIQNGKTGMTSSILLKENAGYNPTLFLGDFTGEGVNDILVSIASGGSGGIMYYYIYSFLYDQLRLLFDFERYNELYRYKVSYNNYYKVDVVSENNDKKYIIDISQRGNEYLDDIYDKNGKLRKPIQGFVNPISGLYPVDFDSNQVYELLAFQKIAGRYNADSLGYVQNILKWTNNRFCLDNQYVGIFGS